MFVVVRATRIHLLGHFQVRCAQRISAALPGLAAAREASAAWASVGWWSGEVEIPCTAVAACTALPPLPGQGGAGPHWLTGGMFVPLGHVPLGHHKQVKWELGKRSKLLLFRLSLQTYFLLSGKTDSLVHDSA